MTRNMLTSSTQMLYSKSPVLSRSASDSFQKL